VVFGIFVGVLDRLSFADKAEQVNYEYLLVGKVWVRVVALPLGNRVEPSGPAFTDEQINADERT